MPKLGHFLKALLELGNPPTDKVWLVTEHSHGYGVPIGRFLSVPLRIDSWADLERVLKQAVVPESVPRRMDEHYVFGFLLGFILGDASKSKQGNGHRHLGLVMSKKYDTNEKIGEFTCECCRAFGLRMERQKDQNQPAHKPHGFYEWTSQSSPFIDWIYNVVLGLRDDELTTYDAVHLDWSIESPREFRVGLIQGIAESDGSVSIASQTVEFWVIPNWDFLIRLLATFGLHGFRNREAVSLVKNQAVESFRVPVFSEHLQTVRYQRLKLLASTPRLEKQDRLSLEIREEIAELAIDGLSVPAIVERLARSRSVLLSFEAVQRWAGKSTGQPHSSPRQSIRQQS